MKYFGNNSEYLELVTVTQQNKDVLNELMDGQLSLLWFEEDGNKMKIDTQDYTFSKDEIVCLTTLHKFEAESVQKARFLRFNSSFYCILNHDQEVSCKGLLFFGASQVPVLRVQEEDKESIEAVWKMICSEMNASKDNLQLEMLQMALKRLLILCTRIYKKQNDLHLVEQNKVDIVREFNFLVEQHFKEKHTVKEYADILNKSPKTISNLFGKLSDKTPQQIIQERIMLEVRRTLKYTELPISEIGYEVGFSDIQSFSRFFKKQQGVSPSQFRSNPVSV